MAKRKNATGNGGTLGFEQTLWQAADLTTAGHEVTPYHGRLHWTGPAVTVATLAQVAPHTAGHTGAGKVAGEE